MDNLRANLSRTDRALRLALGIACIAAALADGVGGHAALALFLFAWVPIVTGLAGWCPLYVLFGVSTRRL